MDSFIVTLLLITSALFSVNAHSDGADCAVTKDRVWVPRHGPRPQKSREGRYGLKFHPKIKASTMIVGQRYKIWIDDCPEGFLLQATTSSADKGQVLERVNDCSKEIDCYGKRFYTHPNKNQCSPIFQWEAPRGASQITFKWSAVELYSVFYVGMSERYRIAKGPKAVNINSSSAPGPPEKCKGKLPKPDLSDPECYDVWAWYCQQYKTKACGKQKSSCRKTCNDC